MAPSPTKGFRVIPYHRPPTPLGEKIRRFHSSSVAITSIPSLPNVPYRFNAMNEVIEHDSAVYEVPGTIPAANASAQTTEDSLKSSYDALESQSQLLRQSFVVQNQERKRTGATYERHYRSYQSWWDANQLHLVAQNPSLKVIPSLPITVAKVTLFLNHEMTRPQKRKLADGTQSTSTCGHEHAKQVVTALEHYRFNEQHHYRHIPEAQMNLRSDSRIKTLESAFAHNEPERIKKAHALKAVGTRADTYNDSQLSKMAISGLLDSKGPVTVWRAMRDRAMLLTSSTTAFRGDSSRSLLWSDMYCYDVPMNAKGRGEKVRALTLIADGSKQNQTGRVDEHGAFRHLCVELCPVGGLGFLFFAHFHVLNSAIPDFGIDFTDPEYGEYGKREWYSLFTFSTSKDCKKEMQYSTHRDRVKTIYEKNDIHITKVTHAARPFAAKTSRENGASSSEVKALGGWSDSGSYRACYDRALPVRALLAAAMFDSEHPEAHFLARESLEPPAEITAAIFPWIEEQLEQLAARESENPRARDISLRHFLHLLQWLRTVVVQDASVLYVRHPTASIFQYPPFNSTVFREFAQQSTAIIAKAEKDVALALEKLPEKIANTFHGAMARLAIDQQLERESTKTYQEEIKAKFTLLQGFIEDGSSGGSKKRRKVGHAVLPPSPQISPPLAIPRSAVYQAPVASSSTVILSSPSTDASTTIYSTTTPFALPHPVPIPGVPQFSTEQLAAIDYINGSAASRSHATISTPSHTTSTSDISTAVVFPSTVVPTPMPLPVIGASFTASEAQRVAWEELAKKYGDSRLRRHQWEWLDSGMKAGTYLPYYRYQTPSKITDIWTEWLTGLNGYLSTRELEEGWGTGWRRNDRGLKTDRCRRNKVIQLINKLSEKRNWTVDLALRFIRDRYELGRTPEGHVRFSTARAFCDYLQKTRKKGEMTAEAEIIFESNSYTS